jgi:NADH:ubiquinone oxidoreductase subunit 5 (subunit L)/multisubunit Na+/H+ antiporter MnhA subunit
MKTITFDTLSYLLGVPALLAIVVGVAPRAATRWLGAAAGLMTVGLGIQVVVSLARLGGFFDAATGGYVGARLVDRVGWPGGSIGLTLEPLGGLPLLGLTVVVGAGIVGLALRGGGRQVVASGLVIQGLLAAELLLDGLTAVAACFALVGVIATLAPLSVLGARPAGAAALRAFGLQRAGDGALVLGLAALAASLGALSEEALRVAPLDVDPWARVVGGLFDGTAHRTLWFYGGVGLAVAVATRVGVFCWPLLRDVTATPDLPPPLVGLVHAAWHGSAVVLLIRAQLVVALAPEAADGFVWAAAGSAVVAGLLACAGRDLLRIDVHLLSGFAAPLVVSSALGNVTAVGLTSVVLAAAALVLPWTFAELVAARGQRDPRALGGLEHVVPRLHTSRLLMTAAVALLPPLSGWVVFERALEDALLSPRVPIGLMALLVVGAVVVGVGAWRALHLVFNGPRPTDAGPSSSPLLPILPMLLLAFLVPGLALLDLPVHLLRLLPLTIDYDGPLKTFVSPSLPEMLPTLRLLFVPLVSPPVAPSAFVMGLLAIGVLPWAISWLLWRGRAGGGRPPGARLLEGRTVAAVAERLARLAGRESPLARTVSEGAERLSRVLATNLLPVTLSVLLQHLPAMLSSVVAFGLRQLQTGGVQRTVVLAIVMVAALLWRGAA